jgi:hypothetical protein
MNRAREKGKMPPGLSPPGGNLAGHLAGPQTIREPQLPGWLSGFDQRRPVLLLGWPVPVYPERPATGSVLGRFLDEFPGFLNMVQRGVGLAGAQAQGVPAV